MSKLLAAASVAHPTPPVNGDAVQLPSGVWLIRRPAYPARSIKRHAIQPRLFADNHAPLAPDTSAAGISPSLERQHLQMVRDQCCQRGQHMRHAVRAVCVNCGLLLHEAGGA